MKITKSQLKKIIKEEIHKVLSEDDGAVPGSDEDPIGFIVNLNDRYDPDGTEFENEHGYNQKPALIQKLRQFLPIAKQQIDDIVKKRGTKKDYEEEINYYPDSIPAMVSDAWEKQSIVNRWIKALESDAFSE